MPNISLIIADDHPIFRIGLVNVVKMHKTISLLAEAENGEDALKLIRSHKPDVVVLDIEMPLLNGLQVCEALKKENSQTKILLLTLYKESDIFNKAIAIGADGYLLKDNAPAELITAIETLAAGKNYFSEALNKNLINRKSHLIANSAILEVLEKLSNTEKKILKLITEQKTTREIASKLFISEKTVENHRYNISKKLGLESGQNNLLKFAIEHKSYFD